MKMFKGETLFLDRADINTDEIIPAKYLTEITKESLKPYLLEDLKMDGFDPATDLKNKRVIVSKENFGCGSSREHAPWALEVNDINVVIATNFARIFRQNMFNCGMLAIELPEEKINMIFEKYSNQNTAIEIDLLNSKIVLVGTESSESISFQISDYDRALVEAGGWVDYADSNY